MKKSKYKGWDVYLLDNPFINLYIVPELGGRIIQLSMNDTDFFFVNKTLEGKIPDSTGLGENRTWLNFGGEKIWPAPQGWDSAEKWPGPPDPIIDSGAYLVHNNGMGINNGDQSLTLESSFDSYSGLQVSKEIILSKYCTEVKVRATFHNRSSTLRKWSIWSVSQMNTSADPSDDRYQIVCPVNTQSRFEEGYKVMHGIANNPQNVFDKYGNLTVHYKYIVGKVGLDTNSDWLAYIDSELGKVMILRFDNDRTSPYPDETSVQIWTQGRGIIYSRNKIVEYPHDLQSNPPYMEMEILSPLQEIQPGASIQFDYRLFTCTIPKLETIKEVNEFCLVSCPLQLSMTDAEVIITGKYGVFTKGRIQFQLKDRSSRIIEFDNFGFDNFLNLDRQVSPFEAVSIVSSSDKTAWVALSRLAVFLTLDLFDSDNQFLGELDCLEL